MITYTFDKPIEEISTDDINFALTFTDGTNVHYDSIRVPRLENGDVDRDNINILIQELIDYVMNKFPNGF